MADQDSQKKDILMLDKEAQKGISDRLAALEKEDNEISFKRYIEEIYPQLAEAIEKKGYTRESLYDRILDDDQRNRISKKTFVGYYHAAKRKWLDAKSKEEEDQGVNENAAKTVSVKNTKNSGNGGKRNKKSHENDNKIIDEALQETVKTETEHNNGDFNYNY